MPLAWSRRQATTFDRGDQDHKIRRITASTARPAGHPAGPASDPATDGADPQLEGSALDGDDGQEGQCITAASSSRPTRASAGSERVRSALLSLWKPARWEPSTGTSRLDRSCGRLRSNGFTATTPVL